MESNLKERRFQLASWTVSAEDGSLRRPGVVRRLEPKPLAVLLHLAERPFEVVSKEALRQDVWGGIHVEDGSLARCISQLRTALDDDHARPRYIETLPKLGYRLLEAPAPFSEPCSPLRVAAVLVVLLAGSGLAAVLWGRADAPGETHVSVAPPKSESARGRELYARLDRRTNEAAIELFRSALAKDPKLASARAGLADAYVQRTKRFGFEPVWVEQALREARQAVAMAPELAEAHKAVGLASAAAGRLQEAVEANHRALALRPDYGDAWTNLGRTLWLQGRWAEALECFWQRTEWEPLSAAAAADLGGVLVDLGERALGLAWLQRAVELEPLAPEAHVELATIELWEGAHDRARSRLLRVLDASPECVPCWGLLATAEQSEGRGDAALVALQKGIGAAGVSGQATLLEVRLAQLLWRTAPARAERVLARAEERSWAELRAGSERWTVRGQLALAAAMRRRAQAAVVWLRAAVRAGCLEPAVGLNPGFDGLRREPAFEGLLQEIARRREEQHRRAADSGLLAGTRFTSRLADSSRERAPGP